MVFKKVFFWLNSISEIEIVKLNKFFPDGKEFSNEEVWKKYPLIGKNFNPDGMTKEISGIEFFLFKNFLKEKFFLKNNDIELITKENDEFFIFNEKLFQIKEGKIVEIDLNGVLFTSLRGNFIHPFFQILEIISKKKGGLVKKLNSEIGKYFGCQNKFFGNIYLYGDRDKYLGNFFLPYKIKEKNFGIIKIFLKENFGERVVLKKDCIQMGKGVSLLDLENFDKIQEKKFLDFFKNQEQLFISEYFKIKNEYRVYFNKYSDKIKIYSIKKRINKTGTFKLSKKEDFEIYKNLETEWELFELKNLEKSKFDFFVEILTKTKFDTGCVEFLETIDGKLRFIEINQMSGPLPFYGKDLADIHNYYIDLFSRIIK